MLQEFPRSTCIEKNKKYKLVYFFNLYTSDLFFLVTFVTLQVLFNFSQCLCVFADFLTMTVFVTFSLIWWNFCNIYAIWFT